MTQLGLGMYTLADAARLIHGDRRAIKRWLYGYDYASRKGEERVRRHADPLWAPQYQADDFHENVIGFQDLLELRQKHVRADPGVIGFAVRTTCGRVACARHAAAVRVVPF